MGWLALLVVGGVAAYVMKPNERRRVARAALRPIEDMWFAWQDERARPDAFRDALSARTRLPLATWTIVALNVAAFLATAGGHDDPETLARWGANIAPLTTSGEWWRMLTAPFLHTGFIALLVDIAGLVQPALLVERLLGHTAFAVVYVSGAALGSIIELSGHPLAITVGPSGGILAVYGLLIAVVIRSALRRSPVTIPLRALRRLAPAAAVFLVHAMWIGVLLHPAGAVPLAVGLVFGMVLARDVAERPAHPGRSAAVAAASALIAVGIALPLGGIVDARPEIARVLATEDRTAAQYATAVQQFKLGAMKAETVAQMIDRRIEPDVEQMQARLTALGRVPSEQQPLVAAAGEYLTLRRESWQLRARALHKSNMRLLRDAEDKERTALAALERIRPPE